MAFRAFPVKRLSGPQFKILFDWFEGSRRRYRAISKPKWPEYGFRLEMSLEEAQQQCATLNVREKLSRSEKRKQRSQARSQKDRDTQAAYLPLEYRDEFEKHKLPDTLKGKSYWNTAVRVMTAVALPPDQWVDYTESFYKEFLRRRMSPAYINNILPLINRWGAFYSRKLGKPFDPVPTPPRAWAMKIAEDHINKDSGKGCKESDPLTPENLGKFEGAERRWLAFTVWFGLRPVEVDLLSQPSGKRTWAIELGGPVPVLRIFQTKLKGVKKDKRTKGIPAFLPEQQTLLSDMSLLVARPKRSDMKKAYGGGVTLYGGRKGFEALMKSKGQKFENVSAWLGHADVNRTYQSYFNKQDVKYDPAA